MSTHLDTTCVVSKVEYIHFYTIIVSCLVTYLVNEGYFCPCL